MKISELLKTECIIPELKGKTKEDIINELIDLFADDDRVNNIELVRKAVLEREKIMSTGVGKSFAIPHAKSYGLKDIIVGFGKTSNPVDFKSLDKKPVNLVFLLVGKENQVGLHIKLLSRISRMMNNDEFRSDLLNAQTAVEILSIFENEENKYF
jgi:fructose-specific phosphotransferase system IIA component